MIVYTLVLISCASSSFSSPWPHQDTQLDNEYRYIVLRMLRRESTVFFRVRVFWRLSLLRTLALPPLLLLSLTIYIYIYYIYITEAKTEKGEAKRGLDNEGHKPLVFCFISQGAGLLRNSRKVKREKSRITCHVVFAYAGASNYRSINQLSARGIICTRAGGFERRIRAEWKYTVRECWLKEFAAVLFLH